MQRQPVNSSNLESVGYDPLSLTLEIQFHDGSIYQYYNVPEASYGNLMSAASHGEYFASFIKNTYSYKRIS